MEETGRSLKEESETFPILLPKGHLNIKECWKIIHLPANICENYKKKRKLAFRCLKIIANVSQVKVKQTSK